MTAAYKRRFVLATACLLLMYQRLVCDCFMSNQSHLLIRRTLLGKLSNNRAKHSSLCGFATNRQGKLPRETPFSRQKSVVKPAVAEDKPVSTYERRWKATTGIVIVTLIIYGLAGTSDTESVDPVLRVLPMGTVNNVIDATVPSSSTDFVAVTIGESIAGVIGASLSALLKAVASKDRQPLLAEALAESDYFIAQAGLGPTLEAIGISPVFATIGSVIVASVPSQLVKINSQQKQRLREEEESLKELLEKERRRLEKRNRIRERAKAMRQIRPEQQARGVDPKTLTPISEAPVDFVEIFSDVTRWLGYNVLMSDYGELIVWDGAPVEPGVTGAILGFIAAFSSRLYADLLYGVLRYGPETKQREVLTRRTADWVAYYASSSISAAVLFGVYEESQGPISRWIQGTLAGGFDGCLGSDSFETCFDAYIQANAPGPSPEAQLRALITNVVVVVERLQDVAGDTSAEDFERLFRSWAVSADSYLHALL